MYELEGGGTDQGILGPLRGLGVAPNLDSVAAVPLWTSRGPRRHRGVEGTGVIARYRTRLSPASLGLGVVAFIHLTMERGHIRHLPKFKDLIVDFPQVLECSSVSGDFDYVIKVIARDLKSLSVFLMDTLMRLPGVTGVRSSVCLDEIKCTSALPLPG